METPTVTDPDDVEVEEEEDARFEVTVTGRPEPEVEWLLAATHLSPSERFVFEEEGGRHSLIIKGCQIEETGMITVRATNKAGSHYTIAQLNVRGWWLELRLQCV